MRGQYLFGMSEAARNASRLGIPSISVIEFGVAGGAGLVSMEEIADKIESQYNVKIQIYGFDLGSGLPEPLDYRDLPYTWRPGFFKMDREVLESRLRRSTLIIGNVHDTARAFLETYQPAPIGFVAFDLDFYSSTKDAFEIFESRNFDHLLPRLYCYFDDTIGDNDEIHCEYVGELLAINEFNASHGHQKIAKIHGLPYKFANSSTPWHEQIYVLHSFQHPLYNKYIRVAEDWQLRIPSAKAEDGKRVGLTETWRHSSEVGITCHDFSFQAFSRADFGYGFAGWLLPASGPIELAIDHFEILPPIYGRDQNAFFGLMLDFLMPPDCYVRVALCSSDIDVQGREYAAPSWGKGGAPDRFVSIKLSSGTPVDLDEYRPPGSSGPVIVSFGIQNVGTGVEISGRLIAGTPLPTALEVAE